MRIYGGAALAGGIHLNSSGKIAFGPFELDLVTRRLTRSGHRVRLQPKSAAVLFALTAQYGSTISRGELQKTLWPDGTVVEFDLGLNIAMKKLRDALGDSAKNPSYIQTLPGEGYRFIARVERVGDRNPVSSRVAPGNAAAGLSGASTEPVPGAADPGIRAEARQRHLPGERWISSPAKAGAALAVAVVLVVVALWGLKRARPAIPFRTHDTVLIADFDNRTGDPTLDGAVETVLRRELNDSAYLSVVPFVRIDDTLRLMKKPASTPITPEVAREVSLRDGGIRAILTGRIQKLGGAYEIDAFVTSPADGGPSYVLGETAKSQSDLLASIHRLSDAVRRRLGEDAPAIRSSEEKLQRVTTPSLRALQEYSQGERAAELSHWPEAEQLFRAALARDPQFASAMAMLAWAIRYQSSAPRSTREREELLDLTERANRLAGTASYREAGFVRGTYYYFRNDQERAIAAFKAVLDVYPDDYWSENTLYRLERYNGDDVDASILARQTAALRPNDPNMVFRLWLDAETSGHAKEANAHMERLNSFDKAGALPADIAAEIAWQPALHSVGSGDIAGAMREANRVTALADAGTLDHDVVAEGATQFFTSIGRLSDAEKWAGAVGNADRKLESLEFVATHRGDGIQLMRLAKQMRRQHPSSIVAPRVAAQDSAYIGRFREARAEFARVPTSGPPTLFDQWALDESLEGEIERGEGNLDGAIAKLQDSLPRIEAAGHLGAVIYASEALARALDAKGNTAGAIAVLEPFERDPHFDPGSIEQTEARFLLSTLYRKAGRISDARKVEAELLSLLRFADSDYPVLVALKRQAAQ